ncbi:MAG: amino acid permease [Methanomassiliicoccales archaeon]|nr:amino acid permease [Methanomassiliicoccales archaeon]
MTELKRSVRFPKLLIYAVGIILGAGVYALIGEAAEVAGPGLWLSFLFGALVASFTGLSYAELSSIKPTTASEYYYVKQGFDRRLAFLTGWIINIVDIIAISTVAIGFSGYFVALFFPGALDTVLLGLYPLVVTPIVLIAMLAIVAMALINYIGIEESASVNVVLTLVEAAGLILIIAIGAIYFGDGGSAPDLLELPLGLSGLFGAIALIFFAYLGFEDLANLGEEVVEPRKSIPKAIIYSLIITTIIYILVAIVAVSVVPWDELASSSEPLTAVAEAALGSDAGVVLSFIALFATINTVLIMITAASRFMFGMAKDRILPSFLKAVSERRRTPYKAIIAVAVISCLFTLVEDIGTLAEMTTLGVFVVFAMINASLVRVRYKDDLPEDRFKSPINIGKLPVLAILGLASCIWMIGTFLIKLTPEGVLFDVTNPSIVVIVIMIITGFVAYGLLKKER